MSGHRDEDGGEVDEGRRDSHRRDHDKSGNRSVRSERSESSKSQWPRSYSPRDQDRTREGDRDPDHRRHHRREHGREHKDRDRNRRDRDHSHREHGNREHRHQDHGHHRDRRDRDRDRDGDGHRRHRDGDSGRRDRDRHRDRDQHRERHRDRDRPEQKRGGKSRSPRRHDRAEHQAEQLPKRSYVGEPVLADSEMAATSLATPVVPELAIGDGQWVIVSDSGPFEQQPVLDDRELTAAPDLSTLNKLKAAILKAEMKGDEGQAEKLKIQFQNLTGQFEDHSDNSHTDSNTADNSKVTVIDQRFLPTKQQPTEMSIQDMLREEIETRGSGDLLGQQLASRIGRDSGYEGDLDYQDEKADELAKVNIAKSDQNARNSAIARTQNLHRAIDQCPLCLELDEATGVPAGHKMVPISIGTRVFICTAPAPPIAAGMVAIVPLDHKKNSLECDDDEWEEIRNFMKSLAIMWHDQGKGILFYENAVSRSHSQHAAIFAVPVPRSAMANAPGFFSEAILSADEEWGVHSKVIDTLKRAQQGAGRVAFRSSIAKEAPYFHVWFTIDGGMGHIVEDSSQWPSEDQFARSVIGGMLRHDPAAIKKRPQWVNDTAARNKFEQLWMSFDWTTDINK